ncbi:MAG: hypothetical protein ACK5L9_24345 [Paracoccus sp. (in: a-proteobacteria)]
MPNFERAAAGLAIAALASRARMPPLPRQHGLSLLSAKRDSDAPPHQCHPGNARAHL